jgi:hypothetical protein
MTETLRGSTPQSEFDLTTTSDDETECACEDCHDDVDDLLTLELACEFGGSAADYGEVGFCSIHCACAFSRGAPYEVVGEDIIIRTDDPIIVEIMYSGVSEFTPEDSSEPVEFGETFAAITGHDLESMMLQATEIVVDTVETYDDVAPQEFTVSSNWF